MSAEDTTFFERERERLAAEITSGFEELLSSSNILNRKLEDVLDTSRDYDTIAQLWSSFREMMPGSTAGEASVDETETAGVPGTGGHVVVASGSASSSKGAAKS
ncbi:DASH outer kinetochore protein [Peniophora sp. CONT]|nr:DASH outer kinetochore protein [Peniophora sp. CONT]